MIGGADLEAKHGGLEVVEGANAETRGGPELALRRTLGDSQNRLVELAYGLLVGA